MTFATVIIVTGLGLGVLILITRLLLSRVNKKSFSLSLAIAHLLFVAILSAIYFPGEKVAQHQLFWMIPAVFDLPVSFFYPVLAMGNMVSLALAFAVLGTIQYAIVGWIIDISRSQKKKQLFPTKRYVLPLLSILIVAGLIGYKNISYMSLPAAEKSEIELNNSKSEKERFYALDDAAKTHFEAKEYRKAKQYASELYELAQKYPNNWNYGNAIYDSHMVLGRIALLENNTEGAIEHLFEAVKTPGSPQLNSSGPNMSLAKDLLIQGHDEPVIKFLIECKRFWYDSGKIDEWVKTIESGNLPDFGANLVY